MDELTVALDPVFGIAQADKEARLVPHLWRLTEHHRQRCEPYRRILSALGAPASGSLTDVPWLPARLFKERELRSIEAADVFRRLTSSGTTGADVSKIDLDASAAQLQAKALAATMQEVLGPRRLPMLIIDSKAVTRGSSFSARGAGVIGMMNFGRHHTFALDDDLRLDADAVEGFLTRFGDEPFVIFGFTFMVWQYVEQLGRIGRIDLSNGTLIHSGGWKKLVDQAVSPDVFRSELLGTTGLRRIHNFYGMVEQIGTIFLESELEDGSLTCPAFADVVIRDPLTFEPVPDGTVGLIETVSLLPVSYPGHAVLTEDLGQIVGTDDTQRLGRRFRVLGRIPKAEARGCSDTFAGAR